MGKLGVKKSWSIWTSSTSPVKKKWNIEGFEVVPECTKDKQNDEKTDEENSAGVDEAVIDTDFINQIIEVDQYLVISSYYVVVDEGRSDILKVTELPEGYSNSDLVFSSNNTSVATVRNDGTLTAISSGSCNIKVSTKDGKYERYCSIRVLASYDVDFTPLSFWRENSYGIAV